MLNSQYSTDNGCETPMPLDVMLLVKVNSIINQHDSNSCSFKANWSNRLQPWASTILFNSTERYLRAIQFSYLPQTSLPWTNQCHQNESPRSHYFKFLTYSSKLQFTRYIDSLLQKCHAKPGCMKNSFRLSSKRFFWWRVICQLLIRYCSPHPYPSLENCFEKGRHNKWK